MTNGTDIVVAPSAYARVMAMRDKQGKPGLMLRITVDGGGCSGFQYKLALTEAREADDIEFAGAVLTDPISLGYLRQSEVTFEEGLLGAEFRINNPNAKSGCGCGASFAV